MNRLISFVALVALLILVIGCERAPSSIESIVLDSPYGGTRLHIWRKGVAWGEAHLCFGALPKCQTIKPGTFDINGLYEQLRGRLHSNVPRENWPNPQAEYGMVTFGFKNKKEKSYLIFDEKEFTESLFEKARKNVVGQVP